MQVKIVIGTVAFMLTMIIMGFAALREPARMERFSMAYEGRLIEQGAEIYKNNCANCHGVEGKAEMCIDPASGEQIACAGVPLQIPELLCGDTPVRLEARDWLGSKRSYIESTIAAGRPWAGMPTWSQQYGGPFMDNQVENVTLFVLNWESEALCDIPIEMIEWPEDVEDLLAEHPGDADRGREVYFDLSIGCNACHGDPAAPGMATVGPELDNIGIIGAERVPDQDAPQYIYESILYPSVFIVADCPTGPCADVMPGNFGQRLTEQEMADLVVYLIEQRDE